MAFEVADRFFLDLTHTFARQFEALADLLKRLLAASDSKKESDDLTLTFI